MTETEYRIRIIKTCLEYKEYLESELKQAVKEERYEDAAKISDEIKKLSN